MTEVLSDFPSTQTSELERYFKLTYKVDVPQQMIVKGNCVLKKSTRERAEYFGKIRSFLCNFVEANVGSTASVVVKDGEFQRAFLFPQACADAFRHSTRVVALDGCHVKTKYGVSFWS